MDGQEMVSRLADQVAKQAARIAELEGLWPLIEEYALAQRNTGILVERRMYEDAVKHRDRYREAKAKITAILKGGA